MDRKEEKEDRAVMKNGSAGGLLRLVQHSCQMETVVINYRLEVFELSEAVKMPSLNFPVHFICSW